MTMVDEEIWLAQPRRRSRARIALGVLLVTALVFLGGVEVQKQFGVAGVSAAAPGGDRPGGAAMAGLGGGGAPGAGAGQAPGGSTGAAGESVDAASAVVGTLVSAADGVWTVEDLGGTTHQVVVGDDVQVVQETRLDADQVTPDTTVDISGTTDDQGGITATTITVR